MSNDHVVGQGEPWAESVFHTQSYDGYRVFITKGVGGFNGKAS